MRRFILTRALLTPGLVVLCGVTTAQAGGAVAPSLSNIFGYVDIHGGAGIGTDTYSDPAPPDDTYTWPGTLIGGAGRGVVVVDPSFSVQGDVWFDNSRWNDGTTEWTNTSPGLGGHLTWHAPNGNELLGLLTSVGTFDQWDGGLFSNVGIEAVHNAGNWRLYGQAGVVHGLTGDAASNSDSDLYAAIEAEYFINPNLFVSGNIGADTSSSTYPSNQTAMNWGAKVEFMPDNSPVSFYVAYQGHSWDRNFPADSASDVGNVHQVLFGLRVPIGQTTLRDLQANVGLSDMNPVFGDFINR